MENYFGIFEIFWRKNQRETVSRVATRQGGAPSFPRHALDSRGPPVRWLMPFFYCKKANIQIEIVLKFQPNQCYGCPGI